MNGDFNITSIMPNRAVAPEIPVPPRPVQEVKPPTEDLVSRGAPDEPVPVSGYHAFLYLLSFFALGALATGVGGILYQLINKFFDDPVSMGYLSYLTTDFSQFALKYGIANIMIAGPVYFAVVYLIAKYLAEGKISPASKVRSWITYIILFLVSAIVMGDLITLIFQWLGGALATRSVLRSLVVLFISGLIFAYYLWDMRTLPGSFLRKKVNWIFFVTAVIVTVGTLISAFMIIVSPTDTRNAKEDSQTVQALQSAKYGIESYYSSNGVLPKKLDETKTLGYGMNVKALDSLAYSTTGTTTYKLCADFKQDSEKAKKQKDDMVSLVYLVNYIVKLDSVSASTL